MPYIQTEAIELPRPMNGSADIAFDRPPVTLVVRSNWLENSILYIQKAVFVTKNTQNCFNDDVVQVLKMME